MAAVVLAEHQTGGRGRRGRAWIAPPGGAICLSLAWQYPDLPADLSALSLVVGVAAVNALASLGVAGVRLKWPNDLVTADGKLGGILIEMRAEAGGPVHLVVGLGSNVMLDEAARAAVAATGNCRRRHARTARAAGAGSQCHRRGVAGAAGAGARRISAHRAHAAPGGLGQPATRCRIRKCGWRTRAKSRAAWHAASIPTARCWWRRRTACAASYPARSRCEWIDDHLVSRHRQYARQVGVAARRAPDTHARACTRAARRRVACRRGRRAARRGARDRGMRGGRHAGTRARRRGAQPLRCARRVRALRASQPPACATDIATPGGSAPIAGWASSLRMRSRVAAPHWSPTSVPR